MMKFTKGQIKALKDAAQAMPKYFYKDLPGQRKILKDLMWLGYVETGYGPHGECVILTPAGRDALNGGKCND